MGKDEESNNAIKGLFRSAELYRILIENSNEAIFFTQNSKIIDCNFAALSMFGFKSKSEILGQRLFDFSPHQQNDGINSFEKSNQILSDTTSNHSKKFNWKYLKSDGTSFDAKVTVNSFLHENQTFLQISICIVHQIEESDNDLKRCKSLVSGIMETVTQPLFAKDENFIYTHCNQAFADYLGKTTNEIIGSSVFQISDFEKAKVYEKADQELFNAGISQTYESKVKFQDGTDHDVVFRKNVILDKNGNKLGLVGLIDDITEQIRIKKEIIKTEEKYKKMFENVQDVFYRTDLNGIITEISPSIERYSNYVNKDIIGQPIENFYTISEDRKKLIAEIQEKGEASDFELLLKGRQGQKVWASVNAHFFFDENGSISGVEGTIRDLTDRKQAEENLKLSLSLLQATLESTTEGILVVDFAGKIRSHNNQFKTLFNIPDQIIESGNDSILLDFVLNQFKNPENFIKKVEDLYKNPELESFDVLELKDGKILERYSCPQRLDGLPIGRVWSFNNVTVRKKAEAQLQLMAHAIKSIKECISITDTEDQILFVNAAFLRTYRYTEGELVGKNISIVRSSENDSEIVDKILEITADKGWQGEILNRRKDGSDFPISLSTSVVRNENNEILGMVGVAIDITESKKAENELRKSEEKYRNLIETMPDGVYRSTPEGKFIEVNDAMVKILGYESKEDLMSIDIKTQLYFDSEEREDLTKKMSLNKLDVFPLRKKDGSAVYIEDHGWMVTDENGKIIFHEGISRNVTDRKKAEFEIQKYSEQLQELNASKDKFFSIIAHDLRSPFNSIGGLSEIIKTEARYLDIATIEQYAGIIHSTSNNTFRLLENLLDWASIQQSSMPFIPETIILKKIVSEVVELMIEKANSKMIAIINYIPENMIIVADKNMIKTILRNLISNALKFTSTKGKIEINVISRSNEYEISIKDSGTGICMEDIDKIFKVGTTFSKRGTENEKGTGLGLMLCKEFVEKHGGIIWVESEEGKGSEFKFSIPSSI